MALVAITREMGSLGTYVGMEVATRLRGECLREDITREAAREFAVPEDRLVEAIEARPGLFESVGRSARRYQAFVAAEVLEAALRERVVIIGRWSTFLLGGIRHAVRVRVCAPAEVRAARLMERLGVTRAEAEARMRRYETGVRARVRQVFDADWRDPLQYALTINTDQVNLDTAARQILELIAAPEFQATGDSRRLLRDRALAARVTAVLRAERETGALDLAVRAVEGRVTLAGTAPTADAVRAALDVVRRVPGVSDAESDVTVTRMPVR
jgi:cytidylate kinase